MNKVKLEILLKQIYLDKTIDSDEELIPYAEENPKEMAQYFYFSLSEEDSFILNKKIVVMNITPKILFDTKQHLYDRSMFVINNILGDYIGEEASSFYSVQEETTIENVKQYMLERGFVQSENFDLLWKN